MIQAQAKPTPVPAGALLARLKGASKAYGAVQAVSSVDIDVRAGEVLAVLGCVWQARACRAPKSPGNSIFRRARYATTSPMRSASLVPRTESRLTAPPAQKVCCSALFTAARKSWVHAQLRMRGLQGGMTKTKTQSETSNRQILLASRPIGAPTEENFRLEPSSVPVPGAGQLLLRTLYLSLDPYMRGRMSDAPSYAAPVALGEVMVGATVARVEASQHSDYQPGDLVLAYSGWQDYALSDGTGLSKLDPAPGRPSLALGVLGMPGFTAYMGLLDIGQPKPGETVVVAAASGAVGGVVGQIAKLKGCRVVGIAGGTEKCRYVVEQLGFDACIDHHVADLRQQLAAACPDGIDVYFENVGGAVFNAVLPLLNARARVPVCSLIAQYNDTALPPGPDRMGLVMGTILKQRIRMQGFIIWNDYGPRYGEFFSQMSTWLREGKIKFREDIVNGLDNAPQAFIGLLQGKNFGKLVVRVGDDDTAATDNHDTGK